ncbi:MAG: glutamate 5-kinase [Bacillota bacterium]|jgi:glutamate 5-kinase
MHIFKKEYQQLLCRAKRIVIKIGTSSLTDSKGNLDLEKMRILTEQIALLSQEGRQMILVTSGAVGAGMGKMNLPQKPLSIPQTQALAAIGQGLLMQNYEKLFHKYDLTVAQILLTKDDFSQRERYLNARNTILALLNYQAIPIINENDTIAIEEIKFGDNDTLASLVAGLLSADLLIILSDVEGFYTGDPKKDTNAKLIPVIEDLTDEIIASAGDAGSKFASGGMITKLQAAAIANAQGIPMVLTQSNIPDILIQLTGGKCPGTLFLPNKHPLGSKKGWLAFGSHPEGKVFVDSGAEKAILEQGSSLLATGIIRVDGNFLRGAVISIIGKKGEIARGITNYSSQDIELIMGQHSSKIKQLLNYAHEMEVVHRDHLSLTI